MTNKIKKINIAVTNKCNLKCIMCDIWKENPKLDFPLNLLEKVLQSKSLDKDVDISLTGGEPFLNKDLFKITKKILITHAKNFKAISTNGTLNQEITNFLQQFKNLLPKDFSLYISLDGINMHNKQRGKSLKKIINTINNLKHNYPEIDIKIKFTITPLNYLDIIPTWKFCEENNLEFKVKIAEYAENYTNKLEEKELKFNKKSKILINMQLSEIYLKKLSSDKKNAQFIKNLIEKMSDKNKKIYCKTPFERIFIMPGGDVYSCIHFDKIGNLNKNSLDEIWNSEKAKK
ncbi:MAG: radical SAM protein [Nanoarchaeota archaeon]|nr:radical SAM protein [Nanoarchaeota archaeon]